MLMLYKREYDIWKKKLRVKLIKLIIIFTWVKKKDQITKPDQETICRISSAWKVFVKW